jgi:hypothetical protein
MVLRFIAGPGGIQNHKQRQKHTPLTEERLNSENNFK